ncbi:OLC1v1025546C1 [Oldenlandia corymbosa var. corymbosa]|uniref:OLC1v1025546C1 n=1 Tax=Oldenlandia corymbosa var. corymbosa TaxID=529605 RepID=A0AAV1C527_OLDCO|nr:OLC1v1025546C1 [Oldenlandia corymbosa var. corymbosa]
MAKLVPFTGCFILFLVLTASCVMIRIESARKIPNGFPDDANITLLQLPEGSCGEFPQSCIRFLLVTIILKNLKRKSSSSLEKSSKRKKGRRMKGSTESVEIPDDLMIEVLMRLPTQSLHRFKCVCKLWNSTISDPKFIDKHARLSSVPAGAGNSSWRTTMDPPGRLHGSDIYVNGVIYWLYWIDRDHIISFEFGREVFRSLKISESLNLNAQLLNLGGSLACLTRKYGAKEPTEIWLLEEWEVFSLGSEDSRKLYVDLKQPRIHKKQYRWPDPQKEDGSEDKTYLSMLVYHCRYNHVENMYRFKDQDDVGHSQGSFLLE